MPRFALTPDSSFPVLPMATSSQESPVTLSEAQMEMILNQVRAVIEDDLATLFEQMTTTLRTGAIPGRMREQ